LPGRFDGEIVQSNDAPAAGWRAGLRVLPGLCALDTVVWITPLFRDAGANTLVRWAAAGPDFRASIGGMLNCGIGSAAGLVLAARAIWKVLGVDPRLI